MGSALKFCSKSSTNNSMAGEVSSKNIKSRKRKLSDLDGSNSVTPSKKKQKMDLGNNQNPMTRQEFLQCAKAEDGFCGGKRFTGKPRLNKAGSVGYNASYHHILKLKGDKKVAVIMNLNATVLGSKKWEDGVSKADDDHGNEDEDEDDDIKQMTASKTATKEKGDTMTKNEFLSLATPIKMKIFNQFDKQLLVPRIFSSGSVGWSYTGKKFTKNINEKELNLQTTINVIVKKSRQWEEGEKIE